MKKQTWEELKRLKKEFKELKKQNRKSIDFIAVAYNIYLIYTLNNQETFANVYRKYLGI